VLPSSAGGDGRSATEPDEFYDPARWQSQAGHLVYVAPLCPACGYREVATAGGMCAQCDPAELDEVTTVRMLRSAERKRTRRLALDNAMKRQGVDPTS
jgi:hypothetical protein